jgi:hypothetical protein
MEPANKDEILSNFIAITQCSNEEATRYLEVAQWNAQTAMEIFFDNGGSEAGESVASTNAVPTGANVNPGTSGLYLFVYYRNIKSIFRFSFIAPIASGGTGGYESDDESPMQSAIEESLRAGATDTKSAATVSKEGTSKKPTVTSKFGTIGDLQKEEVNSDEEGY